MSWLSRPYRRGPLSWALWALTLLGLYVGAYFARVGKHGSVNLRGGRVESHMVLHYGSSESMRPFWISFFRPLHRIDRKVRPEYWELVSE